MNKNLKITLGSVYLIILIIFLYFIFSKFDIGRINDFSYYKSIQANIDEVIGKNLIFNLIIFFLFSFIWVVLLGFGSPILLLSGILFGKWIGTFLVVIGLSIGASLLYLFSNFFLKDLIKEKFLSKYKNLEEKFKRSEFIYLLIYRFIGGIPFAISNILPSIFNVKVINFFLASFIGLLPQIFLICSIGSGLEKVIDENLTAPGYIELISSSDIYIPLVLFFALVIITILGRKIFYK